MITPIRFEVRSGDSLSAQQLYDLLRLRVRVLVLETHCLNLDLDNNDLLPSTLHVQGWVDDELVANARILRYDDYTRLGKVVVAPEYRKHGFGPELIQYSLKTIQEHRSYPRHVMLDARYYVVDWYKQFDFVPTGPRFDKGGIEHQEMERTLT